MVSRSSYPNFVKSRSVHCGDLRGQSISLYSTLTPLEDPHQLSLARYEPFRKRDGKPGFRETVKSDPNRDASPNKHSVTVVVIVAIVLSMTDACVRYPRVYDKHLRLVSDVMIVSVPYPNNPAHS